MSAGALHKTRLFRHVHGMAAPHSGPRTTVRFGVLAVGAVIGAGLSDVALTALQLFTNDDNPGLAVFAFPVTFAVAWVVWMVGACTLGLAARSLLEQSRAMTRGRFALAGALLAAAGPIALLALAASANPELDHVAVTATLVIPLVFLISGGLAAFYIAASSWAPAHGDAFD